MTRPGVTYFEVATAAQEIIASGLEPTIERIRAKLKTGSNSTIGTHLRVFRTKQDPLKQLATKEKIPEELIGLLKGFYRLKQKLIQLKANPSSYSNKVNKQFCNYKKTIFTYRNLKSA